MSILAPPPEGGHSYLQHRSLAHGCAETLGSQQGSGLAADSQLRPPGSGHLGIEIVSGQSAATSVWATSPLKILVPRPRGPSVWACLSSLGGGMVAGDEIELALSLGAQARCFLTTQASTKVYRNPDSRPCTHHLTAQIGPGSLLAHIPDAVQGFGHSDYTQRQEFSLHTGSGLVLVDWLCSGRVARGERWAFQRFKSRNEVFCDGSCALVDSLLLDPGDGPLDGSFRMGRFNCMALVLLFGGLLQEQSARLLEEVANAPLPRQTALICSASPVSHGVLLRLAGASVEIVAHKIRRFLAFLPALLQDDPWSRKW